jgi:uncharacterized membrane protein YhaH (DUF805 family)
MNAFDYYLKVWKDYANFTGRARRSEYWYFGLFHMLAIFVLAFVGGLIDFPYLIILSALAGFVPSIAVIVRRLHDTNRSGWYYFMGLIPLIGGIILIVFFCEDSYPDTNKWGANPKNPLVAENDIIDHLVD